MNNFQKWLNAAQKLAVFHEAKVKCPECEEGHLKVFDIAAKGDNSVFERVLFCGNCGAQNSMRMTDAKRYLGEPKELSDSEQQIVNDIKVAFGFSEKAAKDL